MDDATRMEAAKAIVNSELLKAASVKPPKLSSVNPAKTIENATKSLDTEPVMQQVQQAVQAQPTTSQVKTAPKSNERRRTPVSESRGIAMGSFK